MHMNFGINEYCFIFSGLLECTTMYICIVDSLTNMSIGASLRVQWACQGQPEGLVDLFTDRIGILAITNLIILLVIHDLYIIQVITNFPITLVITAFHTDAGDLFTDHRSTLAITNLIILLVITNLPINL